ncbi:hypothetical protein [Amycolatopsis sp. ATCC 39116]|uniref:hypothetical protein n=1 Tax=Amycolatopsis sp. (strain ATCC 39116 / 75iv2) TaxID=385957 RepID=UPI0002625911|nr:hypothetical protein [Amycolatopsis sp. ATCC 39116]
MSVLTTLLATGGTGAATAPVAALLLSRRARRATALTTAAATITGLAGAGVLTGVTVPDLAHNPIVTTTVGMLLAAAVVIGLLWITRQAANLMRPRPATKVVYVPEPATVVGQDGTVQLPELEEREGRPRW